MPATRVFVNKLKEIHSAALSRTGAALAEAARQSEQSGKFRDEYSALASRLNRELIMPTLIRFASTIPHVTGPIETNERLDDNFDSYDAGCEIAPVTSREKPVKLRVRIRPDTVLSGLTIECEITGKEAELFHDATDFGLDIDERKVQDWVEDAIEAAYRRFCDLNYPPIPG